MKRMVIPKEQLIPKLKEEMVPKLKKEMKRKGITSFKYVDMEWDAEGLIIYYNDSSKGPIKAEGK